MRKPLLLSLLIPILLIAQTQTRVPVLTAQNQGPKVAGQTEPRGAKLEEAREQIEEAVKHLLVSQVEAWNKGNLEGFMQGYWQSPDLTFFSGTAITKGWEPTIARYRKSYQSEGREMGHLEFQDLAIDPLSARSAVVTGKWQLSMKDGKQPHGLFTLILKRIPGAGWRIVHDHTSGE
jgi:ketosteroid isomerase-like protein